MKVDIDKIKPDPNQPRKVFSKSYIEGLAKNLETEGMINPIEIDEDNMIITGEQRWRAAKLAGWTEVPVNLNKTKLDKYKRFRRQMAENLHQSSADGGTPMNAIDVAEGYKKMLEMKGYLVGPTKSQGQDQGISELASELGISEGKIRTYLNKLWEPDYVRKAIIKDTSKMSAFDEANQVPEEIEVNGKKIKTREEVKKGIAKGEIKGHKQVRRFAKLAKVRPDKAELELARLTNKQSTDANRVLDTALELQIALKKSKPEKWMRSDLNMVRGQLSSVSGVLRSFLGKLNKID